MKKQELLIIRDVKARKFQFGALALIIALGVAIYVTLTVAFDNVGRSYDRTYDELRMADFTVKLDRAPQSVVDTARGVDGVEAAVGRVVLDTVTPLPDGAIAQARVIGVPAAGQPEVNALHVDEGRYFAPGDSQAVLVDRHFYDHFDLEPGDSVTLLAAGRPLEFEVLASVSSPEYLISAASLQDFLPSPRRFGVFFLPQTQLQELFGYEGEVNEVNVLLSGDSEREEIIASTRAALQPYGVETVVRSEDVPSRAATELDLEGARSFAVILPVLMLAVAALAIFIALSRMVRSQTPIIGLFRALGYGSGAVVMHYLLFAFAVALVGSVVGAFAGLGLSVVVTDVYTSTLGLPLVKSSLDATPIVVAVGASLVAAGLAAVVPAWSAARILPAEAMRETPELGLATRLPVVGRLHLPVHLPMLARLSLRNIWRRARRTIYTLTAVSGALVLAIVALGTSDSMYYLLDTQFIDVERWDAAAVFSSPQGGEVVGQVEGLSGVRSVEAAYQTTTTVGRGDDEAQAELIALDPDAELHGFRLAGGGSASRALSAPAGVILARSIADALGAGEGGEVRVDSAAGRSALTVTGVSDEPFGGVVYVSRETAASMGLPADPNTLFIATSRAEQVQRDLYGTPGLAAVLVKEQMRDDLAGMMGLFDVMANVLLVFALIMGGAIIFNTVTVNVLDREREMATMRTIGSGWPYLSLVVLLENLALTALALIPGLLAGTYAAGYVIGTFDSEFFSMTSHVAPTSYLTASVLVLVVAAISTLPASARIARLDLAKSTKVLT